MKLITGEYDEYGYQIMDEQGEIIYTGGNHISDSTQIADLYTPSCLSLAKVRAMCIKTAKEMADESGVEYGGVERVEMEVGY